MKRLTKSAKRATLCCIAIVALVTATAVARTSIGAPPSAAVDFPFDLAAQAGDTASFNFKIVTPGCILAQIKPWTSSSVSSVEEAKANRLQLSLKGSNRPSPYASRSDSSSVAVPLSVSFAAFPVDVGRVVSWTISVANVTGLGSARGVVRLEYPPTQAPCVLKLVTNQNGGVDVRWLYPGKPFSGSFLVERSSNNGATWSAVDDCSSVVSNETSYSCTDTRVTEGVEYLYRACSVTSGSACSTSNVTPPLRITVR